MASFPGLEARPEAMMGIPQQRPGLFGRARNWMSQERDGLTNADRLYAVGGALKDLDWTSGGGHFDAAMQRNDQARQEYEQQQARQQYAEAMQAIFADGKVEPQELGQLPGATFDNYMALQKANEPEYETIGGRMFRMTPEGPEMVWEDPYAAEKSQAEIAALRALSDQRSNQADFYGAKADQPYAPPRGGVAGAPAVDPLAAIEAELRRRGALR
jgi:hypothetical protein